MNFCKMGYVSVKLSEESMMLHQNAGIAREFDDSKFDYKRMGILANIAVEGLGIPIEESSKFWFYDSSDEKSALHGCNNLDSLSLCLRDAANKKSILISVRARTKEEICDRVVIRMINHASPHLLGAEYEVFIQEPGHIIIDETITILSAELKSGRKYKVEKIVKSSLREVCDIYGQDIALDKNPQETFLGRNVLFNNLKQMVLKASNDATQGYVSFLLQKDVFCAMRETIGDMTGYHAVPSSAL